MRLGSCERAWVLGIAIVLLDGCEHSYCLQQQGPAAILIPPVPPLALTGIPPASEIRLPKARRDPAILNGCDIQTDLLTLQWFGNTAEIRLKAESYFPAPGDERAEEVAPRVYLDASQGLEAFRRALDDREAKGCLSSDEVQRVKAAIAERFPLPPSIAHAIRFGGGATGFVDLTADFRMKVVSPIRSADNPKEIIDYQVAYYALTPEPKGTRIHVSLSSVSTSQSKSQGKSSSKEPIDFPASFRFFRLLFRTDISSADHFATMLSAEDEGTLNEATRRFDMQPDCMALSMPGVTCVTPPQDFSVNLEFSVWVNDKQVFVPLGGTISDAMRSVTPFGKSVGQVPTTLRVRRLFRGHLLPVKFDSTKEDILRFVLMPGDKIAW
jgi:hypothetical protein